MGKVSPILITLTSRSDSDLERSNASLKENKPDGVNRTPTISITTFERMKENSMVFGRLSHGNSKFRKFLWVYMVAVMLEDSGRLR